MWQSVQADFSAGILAAVDAVEDGQNLERLLRRDGRRFAFDDGLGELDAFLGVGFADVGGALDEAVIVLLRFIIGLQNFALGPMAAAFRPIQPHLHIFAFGVVV